MTYTPTSFAPDFSDVLIQLMGETQNEYAALKALHRHDGKWDVLRAALVRKILMEKRQGPPPEGVKQWTDKLLDAAAHSDPRYIAFCTQGAVEAARFEEMTDERVAQAAEIAQMTYNPTR